MSKRYRSRRLAHKRGNEQLRPKKPEWRSSNKRGQPETQDDDPNNRDPEPAVTIGLVRCGCSIKLSWSLDNVYKIDALVEYVLRGPKDVPPIGLQITKTVHHSEKARAFVREASKYPDIGPLLYAEIVGRTTPPMYTALRNALLELWNTPLRREHKAWGITVNSRGECRWFPIS